jgi:D-alanyl-lipoteichoic acid acyltransferase DltB (MBOAT superfamily)
MNFAELRFWGYLLLGLLVISGVRALVRRRAPGALVVTDRVCLALLGVFLLLCVNVLSCAIFVTAVLVTYFGLRWILRHDGRGKRKYLWVLIPLQLAPLFYYKYSNFVVNDVLGADFDVLRHLIIPVGLSFYLFQMVGFVLDTLAFDAPLPKFLDFMNFAGFFPQIVAGPIERRKDLLPQVQQFRFRFDWRDVNEGAPWIALGLFFKLCLADNLAQWMGPFQRSTTNAWMIWMANLLFGLRIYYDFAGYSLVALGLGRCLGIRLTLNFLSPYVSRNIQEFWRRWHITLSHWFRDYVYIPMGGSRTPWWAWNVMVVFVVSGIWHGAGWNFVFWGALHGVFLVGMRLSGWRKILPGPVAWGVTMIGTFLAWLCFYETRFGVLWQKLGATFNPAAYAPARLNEAAHVLTGGDPIVVASLLALAGATLLLEWLSVRRHDEPFVLLRKPGVLVVLVVLTVLLAPSKNNAFIYFAF